MELFLFLRDRAWAKAEEGGLELEVLIWQDELLADELEGLCFSKVVTDGEIEGICQYAGHLLAEEFEEAWFGVKYDLGDRALLCFRIRWTKLLLDDGAGGEVDRKVGAEISKLCDPHWEDLKQGRFPQEIAVKLGPMLAELFL